MKAERFRSLFEAYLNNTISASELSALSFALSDEKNKHLLDELLQNEYEKPANIALNIQDRDEVYERIKNLIVTDSTKQITTKIVRISFWNTWTIAASILLFITIGTYLYNLNTKQHIPSPIKQVVKNDVGPGLNKATLTLADGSKIILTDSVNGLLAKQNNVTVSLTSSGKILYESNDKTKINTVLQYNTLSTARHEQFQVVLPDGSKVWLNSASSLQYPIAFNGKERVVKLNGQAYFEIFHNSQQPFIVESKDQKVMVTGTHFDVNAYSEENGVRTTLLEGSVKVTTLSGKTKVLNINQQSINQQGELAVKKIDPEVVEAWKNGYFMFDDENLESIMRQLARWYDVQIIFQDEDLKRKIFAGSITKFANISEVLKMLQMAGAVHFRVENKKIFITQ